MNETTLRFSKLARNMIESELPAFRFWQELEEMLEIVREFTDFRIDPNEDIGSGESQSLGGQALSPTQAVMCADDAQRTIVFARGLFQAVTDLLENRPQGAPVKILYAGSGPYATLALPLMALMTPDQVQLTIIDMHETCLASVRSILDGLGFSEHVVSILKTDACEYRTEGTFDVVLSETMKSALETEPQVVIARHLMNQQPGAIMIPEQVTVSTVMMDEAKEFTPVEPGEEYETCRDRLELGVVFQLTKESITAWKDLNSDTLPAALIRLPEQIDSKYSILLCTEIQVYGPHILRTHDCGLTVTNRLPLKSSELKSGAEIQFSYRLSGNPGLVATTSP